jgi:hypothetical protein
MSIEKKSLVSDRATTKKAIVAKTMPRVSKVASVRQSIPRVNVNTFRIKK